MSNDVDVMLGIAQLGDTAGVWDYDPAGYDASETGAFFKKMPDTPDRCVVITAYTIANLPNQPLDKMNVQIRFRGLPDNETDVDELGGAAFALLHGLTDRTFGGVHVTQMLQKSSLPMGLDQNNRWERSDNYTLDVDVPATANRPY